MQHWWVRSVFGAAQSWLGVGVDFGPVKVAPGRRVIIFAQHTSLLDALLPTLLIGRSLPATDGARTARHVLKRELSLSPSLGIFGHRHPNYFVHRGAGDRAETLSAIETLAREAGDEEVLVIFPEGTFRSATNPDRVVARLRRRDPERAERLDLRHTLPPRPGGPLALLRGAPDADVVFLAHAGFQPFGSVWSIMRNVPLRRPVETRQWHTTAAEFGDDPRHATAVMDRYWQQMDDWIDTTQSVL